MNTNKQLNIEKRVSTVLPIDAENPLIIIPKNVEIGLICTDLNPAFEELRRKEDLQQKLDDAKKKKIQQSTEPKIDKFARPVSLLQKKKVKPSPPPIDVEKVKDNCIKLERSIATLERDIEDLQKVDNKSNEQKQKEINEVHKINGLIDKWKSACQEGIIELQRQLQGQYPDMTLNTVVELLKVDPEQIGYDMELGDFKE